jgi:hypothetical protein
MIAGFDDSALMKAFGQENAGILTAPAAIEAEAEWQYRVTAISYRSSAGSCTLLSLMCWR